MRVEDESPAVIVDLEIATVGSGGSGGDGGRGHRSQER